MRLLGLPTASSQVARREQTRAAQSKRRGREASDGARKTKLEARYPRVDTIPAMPRESLALSLFFSGCTSHQPLAQHTARVTPQCAVAICRLALPAPSFLPPGRVCAAKQPVHGGGVFSSLLRFSRIIRAQSLSPVPFARGAGYLFAERSAVHSTHSECSFRFFRRNFRRLSFADTF